MGKLPWALLGACTCSVVALRKLDKVRDRAWPQLDVDNTPFHYWPSVRGPSAHQFGSTDVVMPRDLSGAHRWSWHHPAGRYRATVAGGPVIDDNTCIYLSTSDGSVWKISPEGKTLWHFKAPGITNNAPCLMGDALYGNTQTGHAFALSLATGRAFWVNKVAKDCGPDAGYPAASRGLFVMGADSGNDPRSPGGSERVVALNSTTGKVVWEFRPDVPVWNFAPLFPDPNSVVFMDFVGGVYRLRLRDGSLVWHAVPKGSEASFTDGGVTLGPNQVVYSCSNIGYGRGQEGSNGILRAFTVKDGKRLWEQWLPQPCNSYPAVGRVSGGNGFSVVVTPGSFMGQRLLHGSVMAFSAATGKPQWWYQAPVYHAPPGIYNGMARGDNEGVSERSKYNPAHSICLPAHWSAANVAGDGTVYAARCDGFLYAVRGTNSLGGSVWNADNASSLSTNFATSPGVLAEVYDAGSASLHGAFAFAPGTMVVSTCDTLHMFKT
eukprot:CAMPEP_0171074286 /NCGR_PEP_ID=MMETSP0766_2-20121228/12039_1 /TAXON_ID=439317 /ORGANISM="Gambierdiscus australes, Strain CAWD 149" /LENGTH=491 /DNA_ID=CAMNT_0011531057 /DNA_START=24 /DNA_END=1499 /DNA_ORIENTATION=+